MRIDRHDGRIWAWLEYANAPETRNTAKNLKFCGILPEIFFFSTFPVKFRLFFPRIGALLEYANAPETWNTVKNLKFFRYTPWNFLFLNTPIQISTVFPV